MLNVNTPSEVIANLALSTPPVASVAGMEKVTAAFVASVATKVATAVVFSATSYVVVVPTNRGSTAHSPFVVPVPEADQVLSPSALSARTCT